MHILKNRSNNAFLLLVVVIIIASGYYCSAATIRSYFYRQTLPSDNLTNAPFSFDCTNMPIGFYADVEYNCRIFHMCDQGGRRIPYSCANDTGFNQEYRICDWTNNFECGDAPKWYYLNSLTYATDSDQPSSLQEEDLTNNYY